MEDDDRPFDDKPFGDRPFGRPGKGAPQDNHGFSFSGLSSLTQLSPETQEHLQRVYGNLTLTTLFAALAVWMLSRGYLMEPGVLAIILFVACMFLALPGRSSAVRHTALYGFGFSQGWLAAPLVNYMMFVSPSTVLMTAVATAAIFGSFTASAYYSPRRQYLYLGGLLGTVLSLLMLASFANAFVGSAAFANAELYVGLFVFALYVLYDTQVIVERAEGGSRDAVTHSMTLFTDMAAIFIRLLIILSRDSGGREDKNRRRRR